MGLCWGQGWGWCLEVFVVLGAFFELVIAHLITLEPHAGRTKSPDFLLALLYPTRAATRYEVFGITSTHHPDAVRCLQ